MPLSRRLYLAAGLATLVNAGCWAMSERLAAEGGLPPILLVLLTIGGGILRAPFELAAVIFVFLPITATLGARTTPAKTVAAILASGTATGLPVAAFMRYAGKFPDVTVAWWSASFAVSAMIWSALAIIFPLDVVASGWRAGANLAIDAALPGMKKADRAIPWVTGGFLLYISPLIALALVFLFGIMLSNLSS